MADADDIELARQRARRRLVGALVLLIVGVIAFPLVFETQPRPVVVADAVEPAVRAVGTAPASVSSAPLPAERAPAAPPPDAGIESAEPASSPLAGTAPSAAAAPAPTPALGGPAVVVPAPAAPVPAQTPTPTPTLPPTPKPASSPSAAAQAAPSSAAKAASSAAPADTARAKALLESAPSDNTAVAGSGRFVVQVGAYAALAPMKEVRAKVEKLGLKTYTQVIENADGKRTRLRVGPFVSRAEAEAAHAKLKAAGLPGNLLAL